MGLGGSTPPFGSESQQSRGPGGINRTLSDLLGNTLISQLVAPEATQLAIPVPLQQATTGLQSLLPSIFAGTGGMASRLGPRSGQETSTPSSGGSSPGISQPTFGGLASREDLGLQSPVTAAPGFLPPRESILESLPPVRKAKKTLETERLERRQQNLGARREALESRIAEREAAGKGAGAARQRLRRTDRRIGKVGRRIERRQSRVVQ